VVDEARLLPRPAGLSDLGAFADLDGLDTREKLRRFT
jgi:hypothetical protein